MRLLLVLCFLFSALVNYAQDCIPLPVSNGTPCSVCGPAGWSIINSPDVILTDGSHPIPGCNVGDISGPSPSGGTAVFMAALNNVYQEGITTVITGLNTSQEYAFGVYWEMISTFGCEITTGGSLEIIIDGMTLVFGGALTWELAEFCFTPSSSSINVQISVLDGPANSIAVDIPECSFLTPCCALEVDAVPDAYTICPNDNLSIPVMVNNAVGPINVTWTSVPAIGVTYLSDPTSLNPVFTLPAAGAFPGDIFTFTVSVTDTECTMEEEITVVVRPAIIPQFDFTVCKISDQFHFPTTSDDGFTGTWSGDFNLIPLGGTTQNFVFTLTPGQANCLQQWTYAIPILIPDLPFFIDPPANTFVLCEELPIFPEELFYTNLGEAGCLISGSEFGVQTGSSDICGGQLEHTWLFTDDCGRTIFHTQIIEVFPVADPEFVDPPADLTLNCDEPFPNPEDLAYTNYSTGDCEILGLVTPSVFVVNAQTQEFTWQWSSPCSNFILEHIQTVTQLNSPDFDIDPDSVNICLGENFDLTSITILDPNGDNPVVTFHDQTPPTPANEINVNNITPTFDSTVYVLLSTVSGCNAVFPFFIGVDTLSDAGENGAADICFELPDNIDLFALLNGTPDVGGVWSDVSGSLINLSIPTNISLAGLAAGTYDYQYLVPGNGSCPADSAIVSLTLLPEISIGIVQVDCSADLNSYQVVVNTNGYDITSDIGTITITGTNEVTISNIPIASTVQITATYSLNMLCSFSTTIMPPTCVCGTVNPPISNGDAEICFGAMNPTLSVNLEANQIANWYDVAIGGTAILQNSTTYVPTETAVGVYQYYVESESTIDGCISFVRTLITFEIFDNPEANPAILEQCAIDNTGLLEFDLEDANAIVNPSSNVSITFYATLLDAQNQTGSIGNTFIITTSGNQIIYAVVTDQNGCTEITTVELIPTPLINITLSITPNECLDDDLGEVIINAPDATMFSLDGITFTPNNIFGNLSAGLYTAYVTDGDGCNNSLDFEIEPGLEITIENMTLSCDDNGTSTNPADDFYSIAINVAVTNPGPTGQFEVFANAVSQGVFNYGSIATITLPADGSSPLITIQDVDVIDCSEDQMIGPLDPCALTCIINASFSNVQCSDNGTANNDADDTFTFDVIVNGQNVGAGWTSDQSVNGTYGANSSFGPFLISAGAQIVNITDDTTPTCTTSITVQPPNTCSAVCAIAIIDFLYSCDDNNTPTDPADDFYLIVKISTVSDPGVTGQCIVFADGVSQGNFNYGQNPIITLPADGSSPNITIQDVDVAGCSDSQVIDPLDPCAVVCIINATFSNIQCSDNGTANDDTDDTFTFDVVVNGQNVGGGWTSDLGINGVYGIPSTFGPYLISNGPQIVNITDDATPTCTTSITVQPPNTCSAVCAIAIIDFLYSCDDNNTPTDSADDFYLIEIISTVSDPGVTGQCVVFADGVSQGNFNYGQNPIITLPADGSSPNITIQDVDVAGCSDSQVIGPLEPCAVACIMNATFSNIQCSDNGTANDDTDDTFTFDVVVNGQNVGIGWTSDLGINGVYGIPSTFGPYLISNGLQLVNITDDTTPTCTSFIGVQPPNTCSASCVISISNIALTCNNNNTITDPTDDFYFIDITTAVTDPGISGQFEVFAGGISQGVFNYGSIANIILPANGMSPIITVQDIDVAACSVDQMIGPLDDCAQACIINATFSNIQCDDNGTGNDNSDDTFTFDVMVNGQNVATGWNSDQGVNGVYGFNSSFGPYLINAGPQLVNITDSTTPSCMTSITVSPPMTCSSCVQTVDAGMGGELSCTIDTIILTATSSAAGNYEWTGPGFSLSNALTAEVTLPGWYYFTATYPDNCVAIDSVEVERNVDLPIANGGADTSLTCDITSILLIGELPPNHSAMWLDMGGTIISMTNEVLIGNAGIYQYVITDDSNGCSSIEDQVVVADEANYPVAVILAAPSDLLNCVFDTIILSADPQNNVVYSWDVQSDIVVAPEVNITAAGTYMLFALDTLSGCDTSDEITISDLEEYPLINIDPADNITCYDSTIVLDATSSQTGMDIIYTWYDGTFTEIPGATGPTLEVNNGGPYYLQLENTDNGCTNIDTVIVQTQQNLPIAEAGEDLELPCLETQGILNLINASGGAGININWSTQNGLILSGGNSEAPMVNGLGYYYVELQDVESGCIINDSILVTNNPDIPEVALFNIQDESCEAFENGILQIDNISGGTAPYTYTINGSTANSSGVFPDLIPGQFSLNIMDDNGCEFDTSFVVMPGISLELDLPTVLDLANDEFGVLEGITNVNANELVSIQWTPAELVQCPTCLTTGIFGDDGQDYTLTIVHDNGCIATASIRVFVQPDSEIYIPNAFSPNEDGDNDVFTIFSNEEVEKVDELIIADRWGEVVFRNSNFDPNNLAFGWDGRLNGEKLNPAVFVYYFRVTLTNGKVREYAGDLTLLK